MDEFEMTDPLLFVLSVLTLLGTPGPTNTLLATSGAVVGVRRSLPLLAGELTGYLLAIAIFRLVLGPVLVAEPMIGHVLKVLVAFYLALIAVRLWSVSCMTTGTAVVRTPHVFTTTLCNPKAFIFAFGIIPHDVQAAPYFAAFSACVVMVGFLWVVFGHVAGSRHSKLVPRIASIALGGFAGLILVSVLR